MQHFMAAEIMKLTDAPKGGCVQFYAHDTARIGIVVEFPDGTRCILDSNFQAQDGSKYPLLHAEIRHQNSSVLYFSQAKTVPDLSPSLVSVGVHDSGRASRALYL